MKIKIDEISYDLAFVHRYYLDSNGSLSPTIFSRMNKKMKRGYAKTEATLVGPGYYCEGTVILDAEDYYSRGFNRRVGEKKALAKALRLMGVGHKTSKAVFAQVAEHERYQNDLNAIPVIGRDIQLLQAQLEETVKRVQSRQGQ